MILALDTETSKLPDYKQLYNLKAQPNIVQLAFQLSDNEGNVKMEFNTLIKPNGWTIDKGAQDVHGISLDDCIKYGIDIKNALAILNMYCKFFPIFIAHNLSFDDMMLGFEFKRIEKPNPLEALEKYCTMKNSTNIVKAPKTKGNGFKWPTLQELHIYLFGIGFENGHDAMIDTSICAKCYFELKKRGLIN